MKQFVPCPKCQSLGAEQLKFTWWGGAIGPRLLTHVKCANCGTKYNGKTGKDNTTGIVIYSVVVGVIAFFLFLMMFVVLAILK